MATRSTIAYKKADGIVAIYSHWDGYPAGVGKTLQENYQAAYKIGKLIQMGDVSSLGAEIGEQQDFDDRSTQRDDWTLFYTRDRGEDTPCKEFETIAEWMDHYDWSDYFYLWNGREWLVNARGETDANGFPVFDLLEVVVEAEVARLQAAGYDI
jgi:hypothetical protein